jgi:hypothetical protein
LERLVTVSNNFNKKSRVAANWRLTQWLVKWLNENSTAYQFLWCIDSFCASRRDCAKRQTVEKPIKMASQLSSEANEKIFEINNLRRKQCFIKYK